MNFLENIAIPQSAHHIELLYGLLILTFLLFVPYLAMVTGSLLLSLRFNKKGDRTNDKLNYDIAKRIIDIVTYNKSLSFALGIIPMMSMIFSYAQILQGTGSGIAEDMLIALVLLVIAIVALYTYKYSFHFKDILGKVSEDDEEVKKYKSGSQKLFKKAGKLSLYLTLITSWVFFAVVSAARESSMWGSNFFEMLFSVDAIVSFLGFIVLSYFITAVVVFYAYFRPNSEFSLPENERKLLKNVVLTTILVTVFLIPVFILLSVITTSGEALNGNLFVFSLLAVIVLLIIGSMSYAMKKTDGTDHVTSVLFLGLVFMIFFIVKDQSAFETSTRQQFVELSSAYEEYKINLQKEFGSFVETVNGADIYNGRCIACHAFDKKVVGPPYNSVLGKYDGNVDNLVNFIMNPVKKNPDYPNMPNQGLKPNEAKAVAEYILSVYKQNNPQQ